MSTLPKKFISRVSQSNLFTQNSNYFGFSPARISPFARHLYDLAVLWGCQGYIEIYQNDQDQAWGRLKSSAYDGQGRFIEAYAHLYHGRVQNDATATTNEAKRAMQDPLVIVTFQPGSFPAANPHDVAVIEFVLNHEQYIGRTGKGKGPVNLDRIRSGVIGRIKLAKGKFL